MGGLKNWIFHVAIRKLVKKVIQVVVSIVSAQKLAEFGIAIDETQLTIAIFAALEALRNFLKIEKGWKWL